MIPLTNKEIKFYERQELCHICKRWFRYDKNKESEFKLYHKVRDLLEELLIIFEI